MRQAGLDKNGELGPENLAYKMLRTQGLIEKLYTARTAAKDQQLSLQERKKKKKSRSGYPFEEYKLLADKAIDLYKDIYDKVTFERGNFKIGPKDDRMIMRLKLQRRHYTQKENYTRLF